MKKDISHVCISALATIAETLEALERNKPHESGVPAGIALIVDRKDVLKGIVTDSDLRHALTVGVKQSASVGSVMNRSPFTVQGPASADDILARVTTEIRERGLDQHHLDKIVVVDAKNRPIDILHRADLEQVADVRSKHIGVVGLGFVGLTLALTLADIGFTVRGFDTSPRVTSLLRRKRAPFFEKGINDLLDEHAGTSFRVVNDFKGKNGCDVYFIAVGTPVGAKGRVDRSHLADAAQFVGRFLKKGDAVILRSTVPIGATRETVIPELQKASGLSAGDDFLVAFAPERTAAGRALEELRVLPQVIGGFNRASSNVAADVFSSMTDVVHIVDTLEEAEAVKLVNNTYRDVTFAFANEVALICRMWGLDTNNVIHAANAGYVRGGVPRPSPGVGGYCLSKDPFIFIESARLKRYTPHLFTSARGVHDIVISMIARNVANFVSSRGTKQPKIYILGFGFKGNPPTSDMRGSPTVDLVRALHGKGIKNIHGYDPVVNAKDIRSLGVKAEKSVALGFKDADVVIVMTNHPSFRELRMRDLLKKSRPGALLFDMWSLYSKEKILRIPGTRYWSL